MTIEDLIRELQKFNSDTEVTVMVAFSEVSLTCVSGNDDEGVYLEVSE